VDHITPTVNHLDGAVWGLVAEKSTLNRAGSGIGDARDRGERGVLSCKVYPLKPGKVGMRR
jgi:hypothetical protein